MLELLLACVQPAPDWSHTPLAEAVPVPQELAQVVVASGMPGELHHLQGQPLLINGIGVSSGDDQLPTPGWALRGAVIQERLWVADAESGLAIVQSAPLRIQEQLPLGYVVDVAAFEQGGLALLASGALIYLNADGSERTRWAIPGNPRELAAWEEDGSWRWAAAAGVGGVVQGGASGPTENSFPQSTASIAAGPVAGGLSGLITDEHGTLENLGARLSSGLRAEGELWFTARAAGVWHEGLHPREGAMALGISASEGLVWVSWSDGVVQGLDPNSGEEKQRLSFRVDPIERVSEQAYTQGGVVRSLLDQSALGELPALPYSLTSHLDQPIASLGAGLQRVGPQGNTQLASGTVRDAVSAPEGLWWGEVERGLCGPPGCFPTLHGDASAVHAQPSPEGTQVAGFSRYDGSVVRRDPDGQLTYFPGRGMGQDMVLLGPLVVVSERALGLSYSSTPGTWTTLALPQGDPAMGREQRLCVRGQQVMITLAEYGVAIFERDGTQLTLQRQVNTAGLAISCASAGDQGWWVADRAGLSLVAP